MTSLPPRPVESHKYDFGHVMVIGGSKGMMGAPRLAAWGALRGGAGMVTLAVPAPLESIAAGGPLESMTLGLPGGSTGFSPGAAAVARDYMLRRRVTSVALGPGLGLRPSTVSFVRLLLSSISVPTVVDADGLNALSRFSPKSLSAPLLLTPHAGEMGRLLGRTPPVTRQDRRSAAAGAARRYGAVVVFKGAATVVSDGEATVVKRAGTPAMATGGMGDVLAGLVAALIGQVPGGTVSERLWSAALMGVAVHGEAARRAHRERRGFSVLATDVADRFRPLGFVRK